MGIKHRIRIFFACNILLDIREGRTTHVLELLRHLAEQNDIICFAPKPKNIKYKLDNMIYIPVINKRILFPVSYQLLLFIYIIFYGIKMSPNVLYARHYKFPYSQFIASKLFRIPYVIEINGIAQEETKLIVTSSSLKLSAHFEKIGERFNCNNAKKIVAVSEGIKAGIIGLYNVTYKKIVVIENGANTDLFKPLNHDEVMKELNLDGNFDYVGFSGSFAKYHGLEDLVKSAPLILNKVQNVRFLLVGDGELKEKIRQMVYDLNLTNNFIFINRVSYEEIPKYINIFDVSVILKRADIPGSPLKLWEYMACGKPVIATNTSDFEALEKHNAGILVDPKKPEDVADAVVTLLKDRQLRDRMGKNGRKYVVENRSWACVARKVEEVMREAIRNS